VTLALSLPLVSAADTIIKPSLRRLPLGHIRLDSRWCLWERRAAVPGTVRRRECPLQGAREAQVVEACIDRRADWFRSLDPLRCFEVSRDSVWCHLSDEFDQEGALARVESSSVTLNALAAEAKTAHQRRLGAGRRSPPASSMYSQHVAFAAAIADSQWRNTRSPAWTGISSGGEEIAAIVFATPMRLEAVSFVVALDVDPKEISTAPLCVVARCTPRSIPSARMSTETDPGAVVVAAKIF
jgi:hypothetical protein